MAIVRLEELGTLKEFTSYGAQTGDLAACNVVPQSSTLPRAPEGLDQLQNLMTSSGIRTATFRFVALVPPLTTLPYAPRPPYVGLFSSLRQCFMVSLRAV
jgi:hypothetical protein